MATERGYPPLVLGFALAGIGACLVASRFVRGTVGKRLLHPRHSDADCYGIVWCCAKGWFRGFLQPTYKANAPLDIRPICSSQFGISHVTLARIGSNGMYIRDRERMTRLTFGYKLGQSLTVKTSAFLVTRQGRQNTGTYLVIRF